MTAENNVMKLVLLRASKLRNRLFRNNVGLFQDKNGTYIKTGLCNGSSDLIGWTEVIVTPEMVGKKIAIFTAIETKKSDFKMPKEPKNSLADQLNFIKVVKESGGIAGIARSDDEYENLLKK